MESQSILIAIRAEDGVIIAIERSDSSGLLDRNDTVIWIEESRDVDADFAANFDVSAGAKIIISNNELWFMEEPNRFKEHNAIAIGSNSAQAFLKVKLNFSWCRIFNLNIFFFFSRRPLSHK